jgi:hypothetical protein
MPINSYGTGRIISPGQVKGIGRILPVKQIGKNATDKYQEVNFDLHILDF